MQDVNSNQGMFQLVDEPPSVSVPDHHRYIWPVVVKFLPQEKAQLILDAGCGRGELACRLAEAGNRVVAVDLSKGRSVPTNGSVRYVIRSVEQPLTDLGPFDSIMSIEVIEHLYSPQKALGNFYEALKPGGTLIMTTNYHGYVKNLGLSMFNRWDRHFEARVEGGQLKFFSRKTLNDLLRRAGFGQLEYRYVGRGPLIWNSIVVRAQKSVAST